MKVVKIMFQERNEYPSVLSLPVQLKKIIRIPKLYYSIEFTNKVCNSI